MLRQGRSDVAVGGWTDRAVPRLGAKNPGHGPAISQRSASDCNDMHDRSQASCSAGWCDWREISIAIKTNRQLTTTNRGSRGKDGMMARVTRVSDRKGRVDGDTVDCRGYAHSLNVDRPALCATRSTHPRREAVALLKDLLKRGGDEAGVDGVSRRLALRLSLDSAALAISESLPLPRSGSSGAKEARWSADRRCRRTR